MATLKSQQIYSITLHRTETNILTATVLSKITSSPIFLENILSATIEYLDRTDSYLISIFLMDKNLNREVELRFISKYLSIKDMGSLFQLESIDVNKETFETKEYYFARVSKYCYINLYIIKTISCTPHCIENFRKVF